jgi:hypothetical protein
MQLKHVSPDFISVPFPYNHECKLGQEKLGDVFTNEGLIIEHDHDNCCMNLRIKKGIISKDETRKETSIPSYNFIVISTNNAQMHTELEY